MAAVSVPKVNVILTTNCNLIKNIGLETMGVPLTYTYIRMYVQMYVLPWSC